MDPAAGTVAVQPVPGATSRTATEEVPRDEVKPLQVGGLVQPGAPVEIHEIQAEGPVTGISDRPGVPSQPRQQVVSEVSVGRVAPVGPDEPHAS